ncbi:kinase-like domain-containing protein [Podospora conica]|nr:kinase-like domain-containing protein [Schizothecium conicum]
MDHSAISRHPALLPPAPHQPDSARYLPPPSGHFLPPSFSSPSRRPRQQHLNGEGKNMSTPTTVATTSLPSHYNIHHPHPHSHSHYTGYSNPAAAAYPRQTFQVLPPAPPSANAPASLSAPAPAPRLPPPSPTAYSSSSSHSGLNGTGAGTGTGTGTAHSHSYSHSATSTRHSLQGATTTLAPIISNIANNNHSHSHNHSHTQPQYEHAMPPAPSRVQSGKRKRTPDWDKFYKNGLPQEVIVIHDSPEPTAPAPAPALLSAQASTAAHSHEVDTSASENGHATKRQKRQNDREPAHYDPVYDHNVSSSGRLASQSKSTVSSDRTNSAIHTTAATSLGSSSSNGNTHDCETESNPAKRRRTTRQQVAIDAKRLEELRRDTVPVYIPPPFPPVKAGEIHAQVIADTSPNKNVRCDDEEGHYIVVPDNDLTDRYQMVKLLGQGTFGKVVQAREKRTNKLVAIKIIRSVQKYRDASKIELRVLATLKANDAANRNRCIHLRECFDFRNHICIVMDLLGQSVFDFLKSNNFVPFPNSQIQNFARQLFTSVAFLHDLNLIHTDLKPENILLCHNEYQTFTYNRKVPSSSTTVNRQATQRKVLLDTEIRLIDFGSATFQDEYHSSVVSTRHYRAPEIILGLGWSFPCDIWSIGCILVEFYTGDALFQTHDNLEHLAMMEAVVSARIDSALVTQVNRSTRTGANPAAKYFKRARLDYPATETTRASRRFVKAMKRLEDIIPSTSPFLTHFLDLLKKIFVYDPSKRISAKDALQHPWFREAGHPDDGTEASRIRVERERERRRQIERRGS